MPSKRSHFQRAWILQLRQRKIAASLIVPFGAFALGLYSAYSQVNDPELDLLEESPHANAVREILLRPYKDDNSEDATEWKTQIASLRILSAPKVCSRMGTDSMYLWLPDETPLDSLTFVASEEFFHLVSYETVTNIFVVGMYALLCIPIVKIAIPALYAEPILLTISLVFEAIGFYYFNLRPDDIDDADDFAITLMQLRRDELEGAKRFLIQEKLEADSSYLGGALYWLTHPSIEGRINKIERSLKKIPEDFETTHRLSA